MSGEVDLVRPTSRAPSPRAAAATGHWTRVFIAYRIPGTVECCTWHARADGVAPAARGHRGYGISHGATIHTAGHNARFRIPLARPIARAGEARARHAVVVGIGALEQRGAGSIRLRHETVGTPGASPIAYGLKLH